MKPIYKILIIIGVIAVVGLGIYFGWQALTARAPLPEEPANGSSQQTEPAVAGGGLSLQKISDNPAFDFWLLPSGTVAYLGLDGRVFNAETGRDTLLSNQTVNALNRAVLSPDGQKILASFGDPRQPQWGIFDLIDRIWRPLPTQIISAAWTNDPGNLVGFTRSEDNRNNLSLIDAAKNPPAISTLISDINLADVKLAWQNPNQVAVIEKPAADYVARVWLINTTSREIQLLLGPEEGLTVNFADQEGGYFVLSKSRDGLLIANATSTSFFFKTLPEKCGLSKAVAYCFVPADIPTTVNLPDDYYTKKFRPVDGLYSYNTGSSQTRKIFTSGAGPFPAVDGFHPQVKDNKIYFLNRYDGFVYELTF